MRFTWRDALATLFVAVGVLFFGLWAAGWMPDAVTAATVGGTLLVFGIAASISAVVPGFDGLVHGSRAYLAGTSALGVLALVAGALAVINADTMMASILVVATAVLWLVATLRHGSIPNVRRVPGHSA